MTPTPVDLLIEARWLIPVEPADTTLEHHTVAVRDGHIVAVDYAEPAADLVPPKKSRVLFRPGA